MLREVWFNRFICYRCWHDTHVEFSKKNEYFMLLLFPTQKKVFLMRLRELKVVRDKLPARAMFAFAHCTYVQWEWINPRLMIVIGLGRPSQRWTNSWRTIMNVDPTRKRSLTYPGIIAKGDATDEKWPMAFFNVQYGTTTVVGLGMFSPKYCHMLTISLNTKCRNLSLLLAL